MRIVCSTSVACGHEAFSTLGEVQVIPGREISAADLRGADALIVRSTTRVAPPLLQDPSLQFVGTATAGYDHLDVPTLEEKGIAWTAAPGCNADSVADYVTAALLTLADRHGRTLPDKTLGVIGVGQVGRRVAARARALGLDVLLNDPPRQAAEGDRGFTELETLLAQSDYVTLHVPLTDNGPWPTRGMVNHRFFEALAPGAVFLNTARGEIVEEDALRLALDCGKVSLAALDVWQDEPFFDPDLARRVHIATPHIAGYAHEGRLKGTLQVYRELCRFLEVDPAWAPAGDEPPRPDVQIDPAPLTREEAVRKAVEHAYDIEGDDARLRALLSAERTARGSGFTRLRLEYPKRHEFSRYRVSVPDGFDDLRRTLTALGFRLAD